MMNHENNTEHTKTTMLIFGGTGDLTHRKLIPALYQLEINGFLPEDFKVISIGRRDKSSEEYRSEILESTRKFSSRNFEEESYEEFSKKVSYFKLKFEDAEDYKELKNLLEQSNKGENKENSYLFYLAVSPDYFSEIVHQLENSGIREMDSAWQRLVIEKPFGQDLSSAEKLNASISEIVNFASRRSSNLMFGTST